MTHVWRQAGGNDRQPLDVEERLANLISDNVAPPLVPEIEILP